jgi:hypothetical protein
MSNITPLIKTLQLEGGTFYSFTSAGRDITRTFNNENLKFTFSKFAALNIPDIERPVRSENFIQFNAIDGAVFNDNFTDVNVSLAESFQNYALNLESGLLSDSNYSTSLKKSVSESVFWKWMKEIGAIRFRESNSLEKNSELNQRLFVEEDTSTSGDRRYQRVVEYVGDLKVVNNLAFQGQGYTEIYMYISDGDGNTPTVLFSAEETDNYRIGQVVTGGTEFIIGRDSGDTHPAGLSLDAFYDYDDPILYTASTNADWHGSGTANSYYLEPTSFNNPTNITIVKDDADYTGKTFTNVEYERSRLDGVGINFNSEAYSQIITNPNISTIQEYNGVAESTSFDFNAILIYYDLFDPSTPTNRATNLYGILFLDNVTPTTDGGFIQRFRKSKFNPVTRINGNSYGLKLNLKFDTSVDNAAIETVINDYNAYSMELYSDALIQMQQTTNIFNDLVKDYNEINGRLGNLENFIYNEEELKEVQNSIAQLQQNFNNANLTVSNMQTLLDMIGNLSDRLNQIFAGEVPNELAFNIDLFRQGPGIKIQTTDSNILISNQNQTENKIGSIDFDTTISNDNTISVGKFSTYYSVTNRNQDQLGFTIPTTLDDVLTINVDDSVEKWKKGQSLRMNFKNPIDLGNFFIQIRTDSTNRLGDGVYGKNIALISEERLKSDTPIIEIICLDQIDLIFDVLIY